MPGPAFELPSVTPHGVGTPLVVNSFYRCHADDAEALRYHSTIAVCGLPTRARRVFATSKCAT